MKTVPETRGKEPCSEAKPIPKSNAKKKKKLSSWSAVKSDIRKFVYPY